MVRVVGPASSFAARRCSRPRTCPVSTEFNKSDLLADLETRQDEVLRLLAELEERTAQALAQLGAASSKAPATADTATAAPAEASPSAPVAVPRPVRKRAA